MLTLLQSSPELKLAIQIAQSVAKEHGNAEYWPAHLLKGILHNDVGLGPLFATWGRTSISVELGINTSTNTITYPLRMRVDVVVGK